MVLFSKKFATSLFGLQRVELWILFFIFRKKTENKELLFNLASKMHEFSLNSCPILPPCSNLRYSKMNKSVTKLGHLIF